MTPRQLVAQAVRCVETRWWIVVVIGWGALLVAAACAVTHG